MLHLQLLNMSHTSSRAYSTVLMINQLKYPLSLLMRQRSSIRIGNSQTSATKKKILMWSTLLKSAVIWTGLPGVRRVRVRVTPAPTPQYPSVATTAPPLAWAPCLLDGRVHKLLISAHNARSDSELTPGGVGEVGWALTPPASPALSPPPIPSETPPGVCCRTLQDRRRVPEIRGCLHRALS